LKTCFQFQLAPLHHDGSRPSTPNLSGRRNSLNEFTSLRELTTRDSIDEDRPLGTADGRTEADGRTAAGGGGPCRTLVGCCNFNSTPVFNRPISAYRLGEMPIQSCGQSVSAPRGKAGARLNAHTELQAKRQHSAREGGRQVECPHRVAGKASALRAGKRAPG
jgi:hypothetical protein